MDRQKELQFAARFEKVFADKVNNCEDLQNMVGYIMDTIDAEVTDIAKLIRISYELGFDAACNELRELANDAVKAAGVDVSK